MKRYLVFFLSALCSVAISAYAQDTVSIATIRSSTTVVTASGDTIGLLGVGLPRLGLVTLEQARDHLALLLSNGWAILVADSLVPDPPTGAKPRYIYLPDGEHLNLRMIADGNATAARQPVYSRREEFILAEKNVGSEPSGTLQVKTNPLDLLPKPSGRSTEWNSKRSSSVQCSATTKKGTRCSRTTTNASGKCWQHE